MTERRPDPVQSARLLRQRLEMGAGEIFLEGMSREEALALLRKARQAHREEGKTTAARASAAGPTPTPASGQAERPTGAEASTAGRAHTSSGAAPGERAGASGRVRSGASGGAPAEAASEGAAAAGPASDPDAPLPDDYDALRDLALGCTRCRLSKNRTQVVFSDGPRDARLMVVGEAPGANEDRTGVPFVGAAGKYLDLLLATVDLSREESVYIANVLKCRPPGNRDPKPDEIETCSPYLKKQIDLVRPRVLLAVGSFSGKLLTGRDRVALGKLRGEVHSYHGVPLVVTYHPAALLRNPRWTRLFWEDLQLLRDVMDASDGDGT